MKSIDIFLSDLRLLDVQLWLEDDRLRYRAAKETLSSELLAEMKERKAEIISFLQQVDEAVRAEPSPIVPVPRHGDLPLSIAQQCFWLQSRLEPDNPIVNQPYVYRFQGELNFAILVQSLNEIIRRHEVLRTIFPTIDGQPSLAIAQELTLSLPIIDLRELQSDQREVEARRFANEEIQRPFNLDQGPLLWVKLLRLNEEDHILIFNMHRIICDGSSCDIFFRELISLYRALSTNQLPQLPPLPIQYADFAHWQHQQLQGEVLESQLNYWKQKLSGNLPVIQLPSDYPRPPALTYKAARCFRILPKSLNEALNALSGQSGCTLFMTLLAAFRVLLYSYTEQEDILIDYSIAGRGQVETEELIGPLSNTLILRTRLWENLGFREFLDRVRETVLEADAHQNLPFETLVEEIMMREQNQVRGRSTLSQVLFALNPPWTGERGLSVIELPGLTITSLLGYVHVGQTKFDLTLVMRETDIGLRAIFECNADIFKESTIAKMLEDFQTLLNGIVLNPEENIRTLALLIPKIDRPALPIPEQAGLETKAPYVAPRNKLEFQLTKIWKELLNTHSISIRDNFFAIGGNSFLAVRLFAQIEEVFQTRLPLSAIFQSPTIEELALVLESKVGLPSWYSLVPIQPRGSRPILFGVHFLQLRDLSRNLGAEQPIYGLRYGIGGSIKNSVLTLPRMQDLAAHFIEEMRLLQSEGPYFLMGHSFGGVVAYEMAQQLVTQGQEVGLLVVFDTYIESVSEKRLLPLSQRLYNLSRLGYAEFLKRIEKKLRDLRSVFLPQKDESKEQKNQYFPQIHTEDSLDSVRRNYTPKPYSGRVVLFQSSHRSVNYLVEPPEVGWRKYVDEKKLIVCEVPGNHGSLLEDPHVKVIAKNLSSLIQSKNETEQKNQN